MVVTRLETMVQEPDMSRSTSRDFHKDDTSSNGSMLGDAVKGLLVTAGVAAIANLGRKMVVQAPTATASDWFEGLAKEHEATLAAIDKLAEISADHPQRRGMLLMNIKHMLTKHALQEELVVYPMLRRHDDTDTLRSLNGDHGEVKAMLWELGQMDKSDPGFTGTLSRLRAELEEHMREEEEELFPKLRERLSDEENRKLTRSMNMAGLMLA